MANKFMIVNTETGEREEILGKYMYYSLPKLIVEGDKVKEICDQIGFPISVNENISATDAFRSATSEIRDRIEEKVSGEKRVCRIYCRDNKRVQAGLISRELLEEFMELIANENLSTYSDHRNAKYISINSMYVADDAKQRRKMSYEFYQDMGQQIAEYQQNIARLIQNGNTSQKILDRWMLKIQALESKKKEYEQVLKQNLSGIDEEFTMLRDICDQFRTCVRSSQIFSAAA